MSRRKEGGKKGPTVTLAGEWLDANVLRLAEAITERTFANNPQLQVKYGERGRLKCEQDAIYHLHYLYESLANDEARIFVDYTGWAKIMLRSRGIDPADLRENLEGMADVMGLKAPRRFRSVFLKFIDAALTELPDLPETLPSFIDFHEAICGRGRVLPAFFVALES